MMQGTARYETNLDEPNPTKDTIAFVECLQLEWIMLQASQGWYQHLREPLAVNNGDYPNYFSKISELYGIANVDKEKTLKR